MVQEDATVVRVLREVRAWRREPREAGRDDGRDHSRQ
jgi:hypothetical protein